MIPAQLLDYAGDAKALLTDQFRSKDLVVKFLQSRSPSFQLLEQVFFDIITKRDIETAVGDQLDQIGKLVDEYRNGADDDTFRAFVRLKILANKSQGLAEDLINIVTQTPGIGPFSYAEPKTAVWEFTVLDTTDTIYQALSRFLEIAKAGGTLGRLIYSTWDTSRNFIHSSRYGGVASPLGFSSRYGGAPDSVFVALEEL